MASAAPGSGTDVYKRQQVAVARPRGRRQVAGDTSETVVEGVQRQPAPAVDDLEEQHAVAAGLVGGFQQLDAGAVFHHAARVVRRQADVLDDGVARIGRVEFAIGPPGQMLVWSDGAKTLTGKGRFGLGDLDPRDARSGRWAEACLLYTSLESATRAAT